jgi:hypothetical protein
VHYYFARDGREEEGRVNYLPYITRTTKISGRFDYSPERYAATIYHLSNDEDCAEVLVAALAVPGVLILHDTKLDKPWRALLDRELISEERYRLEETINSACKVPNIAWMGSLLKTQKHVVVFSAYQKQLVEKVAASVNPGLPVTELQLPVGNLVYPESMPDKTIEIGTFRLGKLMVPDNSVETIDDFQRDEAFSKTRMAIFDKAASKYQVASAMRFGVVPIVASGEWRSDLSDEVAVQYKTMDEAKERARVLLADSPRYTAMNRHVSEYAQACSTRMLSDALRQIIEEERS